MKKIWEYFVDLACSLSYARAAAELARQGQHEAAKNLLSRKI